MVSLPKRALAALTLFVASACAESPVIPAAVSVSERAPAALLGGGGGATVGQITRPRLNVTDWTDSRTLVTIDLLTPAAANGIGPGSALLITIPNEGTFGCTANFVWQDGSTRYLGAAGHCFVPAALKATHGEAADYDASGVLVDVCVSGCLGSFQTHDLTGTWVRLGSVAYARQASPTAEQVGHDFGVVAIPAEIASQVRTSMPVWGGPTGVHTLALGQTACHYGHGLLFGEVFATKARTGVGGISDAFSWGGDFAAGPGDSGSAMVECGLVGTSLTGRGAVGILTHLGVQLDPLTGGHGVVLGTTVARAIAMATEAGLQLSLVLQ
jgi:hypothetical protein